MDRISTVVSELGRLYRAVKAGKMEAREALVRAYLLRELRTSVEAHSFEARLDALEAKLAERPGLKVVR